MTNSYEQVEKVARAIYGDDEFWCKDWPKDKFIAQARRVLATLSTDTAPAPAISGGETPGPYEPRICKGVPADCCDYAVVSLSAGREVCRVWTEADARRIAAALAAADRSAAAAAPDMVSLPRADYERLVYAAECDDNIVKCEICDAWLDREETANIQDFTSCWRGATDRASDPCFRHRSILPAAAPAPQQGESKS